MIRARFKHILVGILFVTAYSTAADDVCANICNICQTDSTETCSQIIGTCNCGTPVTNEQPQNDIQQAEAQLSELQLTEPEQQAPEQAVPEQKAPEQSVPEQQAQATTVQEQPPQPEPKPKEAKASTKKSSAGKSASVANVNFKPTSSSSKKKGDGSIINVNFGNKGDDNYTAVKTGENSYNLKEKNNTGILVAIGSGLILTIFILAFLL